MITTCSYSEYTPDLGMPVCGSVGRYRWWKHEPLHMAGQVVAPDRAWIHMDDRDAYEKLYIAKLDRDSDRIDETLNRLETAAGSRDVVLMCFEDLSRPGNWCHRRMFADWWHARHGFLPPEVGRKSLVVNDPEWDPLLHFQQTLF